MYIPGSNYLLMWYIPPRQWQHIVTFTRYIECWHPNSFFTDSPVSGEVTLDISCGIQRVLPVEGTWCVERLYKRITFELHSINLIDNPVCI